MSFARVVASAHATQFNLGAPYKLEGLTDSGAGDSGNDSAIAGRLRKTQKTHRAEARSTPAQIGQKCQHVCDVPWCTYSDTHNKGRSQSLTLAFYGTRNLVVREVLCVQVQEQSQGGGTVRVNDPQVH